MINYGLQASTVTIRVIGNNYYLQTISNNVVFVLKCAGIDKVLIERDEFLEEDEALVPIKQSNGKDGTLRLDNKHRNQKTSTAIQHCFCTISI